MIIEILDNNLISKSSVIGSVQFGVSKFADNLSGIYKLGRNISISETSEKLAPLPVDLMSDSVSCGTLVSSNQNNTLIAFSFFTENLKRIEMIEDLNFGFVIFVKQEIALFILFQLPFFV